MTAKELARLQALCIIEDEYYGHGVTLIAGVDEAGRGPLAGPVAAAAVILPPHCLIEKLNDSKKISAKNRPAVAAAVKEQAIAWHIALVDAAEIDELNILQATKKAMWQAICGLAVQPQTLLIDGNALLPQKEIQQRAIVGGDHLSASVAAASVLAKCCRDELMLRYHEQYPQYGFDRNKGYGTKEHIAALRKYGPTPIHRRSFHVTELEEATLFADEPEFPYIGG